MNTLWQNIRYKMMQSDSRLPLLIGINVIVYLAVNVPAVFERMFFQHDLIGVYANDYLNLTPYLPKLLTRFWTPITYMFMHEGVFHILFNMLWLYWIGQIFEEYLGYKKTITLYVLGGLGGAALYILAYNFVPLFSRPETLMFSSLVGASAGVMAIIIATATLLPDYTIFMIFIGPVKLKWIALFFIIIDFLSITGPNAGGEIAHLGGALVGFIFIRQLQKGNDWSKVTEIFKPKPALKVTSRNTAKKTEYKPRQDEIDRILDKISQSGYDTLNKQEKDTLFRASNHEDN